MNPVEIRIYSVKYGEGILARYSDSRVECARERGWYYAYERTTLESPIGVGDTAEIAFKNWESNYSNVRYKSKQ